MQALKLPSTLMHPQADACLCELERLMRANAQMDSASEPVVIDASGLEDFDSSALAVLLACRRAAIGLGRGLHVAQMSSKLTALAQLYGVLDLLAPSAGA